MPRLMSEGDNVAYRVKIVTRRNQGNGSWDSVEYFGPYFDSRQAKSQITRAEREAYRASGNGWLFQVVESIIETTELNWRPV